LRFRGDHAHPGTLAAPIGHVEAEDADSAIEEDER